MHPFPHHYQASATAVGDSLKLNSPGLSTIESAAPESFGGPGDKWSPETLLIAAVADCFVLTFKAVASASEFAWQQLDCDVEGVLDKVDRVTQFTAIKLTVVLKVEPGADKEKATRLLERSKSGCLISNSLKAPVELETRID